MRTPLYVTTLTLAILVAVASRPAAPRAQTGAKPPTKPATQARTQEQLLQDAIQLMNAKGDYVGAARLFEAASRGTDRRRSALALLYLAQVYQKQGNAEAERTLRHLIDRYKDDQPVVVAEARVRLAALTTAAGALPSGKMVRSNWSAGEGFDAIGPPSRDGQYMPGIDWNTSDLMLVELATRKVRRIGKLANGQGAAVAPDNREIAFVAFASGDGKRPDADEVRVVKFDGTGTRTIHRNEGGDTLLDNWTPDGKRVLVLIKHPAQPDIMVLLDVVTGETTELYRFEHGHTMCYSLSPDGKSVVYDFPQQEGVAERDIFLLDVESRKTTPLVVHPASDVYPFWAPDGKRILFASNRTGTGGLGLWMLHVANGRASGDPLRLEGEMGRWSPIGLARNGTLYYSLTTGLVDVFVAPIDLAANAAGRPVAMAQRFLGSNLFPGWSADSRQIAFTARRGDVPYDLHSTVVIVHDMASSVERELKPDLAGAPSPRWSPTGQALLIGGNRAGKQGWYLVDATSAKAEFVEGDFVEVGPPEWAPDGSRIVVRTKAGLEALDLRTRERREIYHSASRVHPAIAWSPDGQRIAFAEFTSMAQDAPFAIRITPAGGGDTVTVWTAPSAKHGIELAGWSPDNRELVFVLRVPGAEAALYRIPVSGGAPRPVGLSANGMRDARISPDGRHVAYTGGWPRIETRTLENFLPSLELARPGVNK